MSGLPLRPHMSLVEDYLTSWATEYRPFGDKDVPNLNPESSTAGSLPTIALVVVFGTLFWVIVGRVINLFLGFGFREQMKNSKLPKWTNAIIDREDVFRINWFLRALVHNITLLSATLYFFYVEPDLSRRVLWAASTNTVYAFAIDIGYYIYDMDWMLRYRQDLTVAYIFHHIAAICCYGCVVVTGFSQGLALYTYFYHLTSILINVRWFWQIEGKEQALASRFLITLTILLWFPCRFGVSTLCSWAPWVEWNSIVHMNYVSQFITVVACGVMMWIFNLGAFVVLCGEFAAAFGLSSGSGYFKSSGEGSSSKKD